MLLSLAVTQQAVFWGRLGRDNWFLSSQSLYFTNGNWIAKFHEAGNNQCNAEGPSY